MNPMPSALTGTISEFDFTSGIGLINADNGDIVFFSAAKSIFRPSTAARYRFSRGLRVA